MTGQLRLLIPIINLHTVFLCLKAMHFGVRSDDINLLGSVSIVFLYPIDFSVQTDALLQRLLWSDNKLKENYNNPKSK